MSSHLLPPHREFNHDFLSLGWPPEVGSPKLASSPDAGDITGGDFSNFSSFSRESTFAATSSPPCNLPLIPNLPDDVSIQILARLSRSQHIILSLVSKSWKSALNSPELFRARSILGTEESSLYICVRSGTSFNWYCKQKTQNLKRTLIPLPRMPQDRVGSSIVALGPEIYVIGGSIGDNPSNVVLVFDCRFWKWDMGPRMKVHREFSAAGVWNDKIYVIGGCNVFTFSQSMNWAEVLDTNSGSWNGVPSAIDLKDKWMHASAVIGSRLYAMADRGGVVYDMGSEDWGNVPKRLDLGWRGRATVVDNVLYCYDFLGKIQGYDVEGDVWKELRGVHQRLPGFLCGATMANLGGKLCVVWEGKSNGKDVDIMCAEIEVNRDADGGLSGTILSLDMILVVSKGVAISHCVGVTF